MEALGTIIVIGLVIGIIYGCYRIAKHGSEKYEMKLIYSWSFLAIVMFTIFLVFGSASIGEASTDNTFVLFGASLTCLLLGGYLNIKKSTLSFGLVYTTAQSLATLTVAAVIFFLIYGRSFKKNMPLINDN